MRKLKLYIAMSLDGKIAGPDGDVSWLDEIPNPGKTDYGYSQFYQSVDTTIMGNSTYALIKNFKGPFPYPTTKNYVASRKSGKDNEQVSFTNDPVTLVRKLKNEPGKDIWLIGGGQLNTLLWNEGLIDELLIFVMPIVLGEGIGLFEAIPKQDQLTLVDSETYISGVVRLTYLIKK